MLRGRLLWLKTITTKNRLTRKKLTAKVIKIIKVRKNNKKQGSPAFYY